MIEVLVWRDLGAGGRSSLGMHPFEVLPQVGHRIEIMAPEISGKVVDIIHSSAKERQQTEIVIQIDVEDDEE